LNFDKLLEGGVGVVVVVGDVVVDVSVAVAVVEVGCGEDTAKDRGVVVE
jgi:hypothetical protein